MCEHKRLKYIGHRGETRVFCADCGKELDKAFLEGKKQPEKAAEEVKPDKPTARKTRAKKAE
jgi:hypothetical protein